jgi:hypothetical protein
MFISKIITNGKHGDHYYIAVQSKRGPKYIWRRVPLVPGPETRVEPQQVPQRIRDSAYGLFERDRLRERQL